MTTMPLQMPGNLYPAGFLENKEVTQFDLQQTQDYQTIRFTPFAEQYFRQSESINQNFNSSDIARIYSAASGIQLSAGQVIYSMIKLGYKYLRDGYGAFFNVDDQSLQKALDLFTIRFVTELPKIYLSFPGPKSFNRLDLIQKQGILRDYLKRHFNPKPFAETYLLNGADRMALKFMLNQSNQLIYAEALPYEETMNKLHPTKTQLITK